MVLYEIEVTIWFMNSLLLLSSNSPNDAPPPPRTSAERIHSRGTGRRASVQNFSKLHEFIAILFIYFVCECGCVCAYMCVCAHSLIFFTYINENTMNIH